MENVRQLADSHNVRTLGVSPQKGVILDDFFSSAICATIFIIELVLHSFQHFLDYSFLDY